MKARSIGLGVLFSSFAVAACGGGEPRESAPPQGFVRGADDHRLFYRVLGSGSDTVVVVHGFQGNNQNYLASDIAEVIPGYALLFYDQRGGGRSDPVSEEDSPGLEEHVADLEALRSALHLEDLVLIGHSGGAYIVVQYALDYPQRVEKLALIAPGTPHAEYAAETGRNFFSRLDSATWAGVSDLNASLETSEDPAAVCEEISSILLPRVYLADPSALSQMAGSMCDAPEQALRTEGRRRQAFQASVRGRDWVPDLERIPHPVLIVHGEQDAIPIAASEAWAEGLPNSDLEVLRGVDHLPWLDQPEEFSRTVTGFLDDR